MQAAAAAQGWNPATGFMGQQFPNYFQLAQQQVGNLQSCLRNTTAGRVHQSANKPVSCSL